MKKSKIIVIEGTDGSGKATQVAIARTVKQLKELGVNGATPEDFVNGAAELVGTRINLKVETNGTFKNKWLTLA